MCYNNEGESKRKTKIKIFEKPLDKREKVCYNIYSERRKETKK
jgi:hypothetical protein